MNGLDLASVNQRPGESQREGQNEFGGFEQLRGIAARYQGITAHRAVIDFSSMHSAFFYPFNLTNPDPKKSTHARLAFAEPTETTRYKSDAEKVWRESRQRKNIINWQGIADMIVARYASRLQFMATEPTSLRSEISFLLNHFIDYQPEGVDIARATEKCAAHYLHAVVPQTDQDVLIHTGIYTVTRKICTTLFNVRDLVLGEDSEEATVKANLEIEELMKFLNWSTWLECERCSIDQVCYVAIWPWGTLEDHLHPRCKKNSEIYRGRPPPGGSYWFPEE
jgi:hypothetical protein